MEGIYGDEGFVDVLMIGGIVDLKWVISNGG